MNLPEINKNKLFEKDELQTIPWTTNNEIAINISQRSKQKTYSQNKQQVPIDY